MLPKVPDSCGFISTVLTWRLRYITAVYPINRQWLLQTVAELGLVVFNALDYGLKEEEERQLSPALENLIDIMTAVGTYLYEY